MSDELHQYLKEEEARLRDGYSRNRSYLEEEDKTFWEKLDRRDEYHPAGRYGIESEPEAVAIGIVFMMVITLTMILLICILGEAPT